MKTVYIETSIPSYLTAKPSKDIKSTAWQQLTKQWWEEEKNKYNLFISELVLVEASAGNKDAAQRRLDSLNNISELSIEPVVGEFASKLIADGGIVGSSQADALHVAICVIHRIDYLLTWNCRHINNANTKPIIRRICEKSGFNCPEICTPLELLYEN